ncbi:hypothetical protein CH063_12151 [Colletotrichum higginsianum]|uniref:Major facilitator superfamily transporter n=1 Tax=Colletotrichum higginsianum (strain IMI 349063) TaxID=759273 RepID=H1VP99_COLHI|nr:Major facilitator superfamily transporter [Colletotrichum higginsianum IMI 349063]OBR02296.1 Major facilitator superfamily transporter [Colletotrichum higginsianum IMI 349063]CCF42053.1 hypothetical protein CH063_12151 [Colletotrichum higginsianum]
MGSGVLPNRCSPPKPSSRTSFVAQFNCSQDSILLSTPEAAIVIVSLVSIRDAFHDFELRHWVVTLYLLTYAGVPVIFVQLSDILGRKFFILSTLAVVAMFSIVNLVAVTSLVIVVSSVLGPALEGIVNNHQS